MAKQIIWSNKAQKDRKETTTQKHVLHSDETGIRLSGDYKWMHVLSNSTLSFLAYHPMRGKQAMDDIGVLENYKGTLVHDRFSSYSLFFLAEDAGTRAFELLNKDLSPIPFVFRINT